MRYFCLMPTSLGTVESHFQLMNPFAHRKALRVINDRLERHLPHFWMLEKVIESLSHNCFSKACTAQQLLAQKCTFKNWPTMNPFCEHFLLWALSGRWYMQNQKTRINLRRVLFLHTHYPAEALKVMEPISLYVFASSQQLLYSTPSTVVWLRNGFTSFWVV